MHTLRHAQTSLGLLTALLTLTHCEGQIASQGSPSSAQDRYVTPGEVTSPDGPIVPTMPEEPMEPLMPGEPVVCPEDQLELAQAPVRRLSKNEYINTLSQHFPAQSIDAVALRLEGLATDAVGLAVSPGKFDPFFGRPGDRDRIERRLDIARLLAEDVTTHPERLSAIAPSCMEDLDRADSACVSTFVQDFGSTLMKRELGLDEVDAFMLPWTQEDLALDTPQRRLEVILTSLLNDPEFLFHVSSSAPSDDQTDVLSQETIAARLSYASHGQAPDEALLTDARAGRLGDVEVRRMHAARLLDSDAGRRHVVQVFDQWLAMERRVDLEPAGKRIDVDINGLYGAMRQETHHFITHIVFEERGSYEDLMTSSLDFPTTDTLANLMGHDQAAPDGITSTTGRAGLLARPGILVHVEPRVSPIHRGVHIMYRFMCSTLTLPVNDVNETADAKIAELGDGVNMMSSRDIAAHQTSEPSCAGCHSFINPLGFALSSFGPLGDSWEQEHIYTPGGELIATVPVDATADLLVDGMKLSIDGAAEYGAALAASDEARACMSTQLFRVTHMREPTQLDACHLKRIRDGLDERQPIFDLLVDNAAREAIQIPSKESSP